MCILLLTPKVCVDVFEQGVKVVWRTSANSDLWGMLWSLVDKCKCVKLHWVKSHCVEDAKLFVKYRPSHFSC